MEPGAEPGRAGRRSRHRTRDLGRQSLRVVLQPQHVRRRQSVRQPHHGALGPCCHQLGQQPLHVGVPAGGGLQAIQQQLARVGSRLVAAGLRVPPACRPHRGRRLGPPSPGLGVVRRRPRDRGGRPDQRVAVGRRRRLVADLVLPLGLSQDGVQIGRPDPRSDAVGPPGVAGADQQSTSPGGRHVGESVLGQQLLVLEGLLVRLDGRVAGVAELRDRVGVAPQVRRQHARVGQPVVGHPVAGEHALHQGRQEHDVPLQTPSPCARSAASPPPGPTVRPAPDRPRCPSRPAGRPAGRPARRHRPRRRSRPPRRRTRRAGCAGWRDPARRSPSARPPTRGSPPPVDTGPAPAHPCADADRTARRPAGRTAPGLPASRAGRLDSPPRPAG